MMNGTSYSLSDIAAATGCDNRANNGAWGGDWMGLIVLLLIFSMFGWGGFGGGFGGFGGQGGALQGYATQADIQRGFDNQSVMNKLNGIEQGICSLGYDQLVQMNGINQNISQTGFGIQQAINADAIANMQSTNALSTQLANCCCETREAIQGVNFNMAQNTCAMQNTMNNNTRDIIENQNAGTRAILDYLCQDKISTLQQENQTLRLAASQQAQNAFFTANQEAQTAELIRRLGRDVPVPAYFVPNPNCCYNPSQIYGGGCSTGCC